MNDFRAACVQSPPGGVVTSGYLDSALDAAGGVDLVVLPEMCNVPYFPLESDSLDADLAITIDDSLIDDFAAVAARRRCHLMLGLYIGDGESRWNAAVLVGPDGKLLEGRTSRGDHDRVFRKVHLCNVQMPNASFCESAYFDAGDDYVVWDTILGSVGVLICYDRHFPEAWTTLRAMGADVICVCTTSPVSTEPTFVPEIQAMALQQSVFVAMANRVGQETLRTSGRATDFLGSSCIVTPEGHVLASATPRQHEPFAGGQLRAELLTKARAQNRFQEHRRPETYLIDHVVAQPA